jgi:hypothetical protein
MAKVAADRAEKIGELIRQVRAAAPILSRIKDRLGINQIPRDPLGKVGVP